MSKNQQKTKMWKQISIEESPLYQSDYFKKQGYSSQLKGSAQNISEVLSRADQFEVLKKEDDIPEIQHICDQQIDQYVSEADKFRKIMESFNVEVIEIKENEPTQTIQEYSHIENVIQYPQSSQLTVLAKDNESYNQNIGESPRSIQKINKLQQENDQLMQKIKQLEIQKNNLLNEANQFKIKISGIEAKASEVRSSNVKLYEYIFDLQQKLAYQNEEIPRITKKIRDELQQNYQRLLNIYQNEKIPLKEQLRRVTMQKNQYLQKVNSIEPQIAELKKEIASKCEELQNITELYKLKNGELKSVMENHIRQKNLFQQIIDQKDQILLNIQSLRHIKSESSLASQIQEPQKDRYQLSGSFMKELIDMKDKDNKRYIESIEGEKIALQRQNQELKAAMQFCNKKYRPHLQPNHSQPNFTRPVNSHSSQTYYSPFQETPRQSETPLALKERQLLKYEGYLQSQAKKLEEKKRAVEIDYLARRKSESNRIQNVLSNQKRYEYNPGDDDYGMRSKASKGIKTLTTLPSQRKNNLCSTQAHAIIQKVKMKHRTNNNSCSSHCDHLNNCRCDVLSRASKASQQSLDTNYYRMNSYRSKKRNPIRGQDQYLPQRQKSSKMKELEEKVNKLKGQLKTSIKAMKD